MTAEPLWQEPSWVDAFPVRTRVRSSFTGNSGVVVAVSPGRHILVEWAETDRWKPYLVRHSSPQGLTKVDET